ncbi:MAG TPA: hypothetical protein VE441_06725 [Mycobacterium sp.]|nr:hypothetical protein [Mycobacterium sp.]
MDTVRPKTVVLKPGSTRRATLRIIEVGVFPQRKCKLVTARSLRVFPPNTFRAHFIKHRIRACSTKTRFMDVRPVGS